MNTRHLFRFLSVAYVVGIFLFADSPVVADLAPFNPYSLLHIPLYGILALLLYLSITPPKPASTNAINATNPINAKNAINASNAINAKNAINATNPSNAINAINATNAINASNAINAINPERYLVIAGLIASAVGIADEIHQAYVPGRNASVMDVFLDMIGIILCLVLMRKVVAR